MPVLSTLATFSTRGYGGGSGVLVGLGWVAIGTDASANTIESPYAIAMNNANQLIIPGYTQITDPIAGYVDAGVMTIMTNTADSINTKLLENPATGHGCSLNSCAIDGLNNIFAVGYINKLVSGSSYHNAVLVAKYNSSGTLLWSKSIDDNVIINSFLGVDVDVSPLGNTYLCYRYFSSPNKVSYISKLNSSGTTLWTRSLSSGTSGTYDGPTTNIIDSSENVYTVIYRNSDIVIIKTDTNGNNVWNRQYTDTGISENKPNLLSIYGTTLCLGFGTSVMTINTSTGDVILQKTISGAGGIIATQIDSLGNIYCLTDVVGTTSYLYSYTSAGVLRYCNKFVGDRNTGVDDLSPTGMIYRDNELYLTFTTYVDTCVIKVPSDGAIPGKGVYIVPITGSSPQVTYTIVYTKFSATPTTPSITQSSISLTFGTTSLTNAAITTIDADSTVTWTTKTI